MTILPSVGADTTVGWWKRIPEAERIMLRRYLGTSGDDIAWELTQACFASVARTAIVCMQDVMRLDNEEGRMNTPGTKEVREAGGCPAAR